MARCSACGTGMTFTESNIALSFGSKCKDRIISDNPEQKDKLQNKTTGHYNEPYYTHPSHCVSHQRF